MINFLINPSISRFFKIFLDFDLKSFIQSLMYILDISDFNDFGTDPGRNAKTGAITVDQSSLPENPNAKDLAGQQPMRAPGSDQPTGRAIKADFIPADPDGWHGEINLTERRKRMIRENKKYSRG